jgi:hypothetical protein
MFNNSLNFYLSWCLSPPIFSPSRHMSDKSTNRRGPKPSGKVTVQLRLKESTRDELERAARAQSQSPSEYAERALQRDFARERKIDFRGFFAKHPPVAGGDEVLQGLLQEREE